MSRSQWRSCMCLSLVLSLSASVRLVPRRALSCSAARMDGKALSTLLQRQLRSDVAVLRARRDVQVKLAVVRVGTRADSEAYVRFKCRACEDVGIESHEVHFDATVSQDRLTQTVLELNEDSDVHGILVQLPLPDHVDQRVVLSAISPAKDVDGLHPVHLGALADLQRRPMLQKNVERPASALDEVLQRLQGEYEDFLVPCTPKGCLALLRHYDVPIAGAKAVVIGRSSIVGLPMSLLLSRRDATVTLAHSKTPPKQLEELLAAADIVVVAVGRPGFLKGEWLKPGSVVIDVGINPIPDSTKQSGRRLVGDCDFESCEQTAR